MYVSFFCRIPLKSRNTYGLHNGVKGKGDWMPVSTGDRMLFHGTTFSTSWKIAHNGFQPAKGMLGTAIYLSESITKADEHTIKDDVNMAVGKSVFGKLAFEENLTSQSGHLPRRKRLR